MFILFLQKLCLFNHCVILLFIIMLILNNIINFNVIKQLIHNINYILT